MDELTFHDDDGVDVFYRRWTPARSPRAVVLVAHGMSEHSGRYARVAAALQDAGHGVYALDHRGHGRTAVSSGPGRAGVGGMTALLDDLGRLEGIARSEHAGVPTVLFGHSMGAILSLAYAERSGEGLDGLALSGSPGVAEGLREMADAISSAADGGLADEPLAALASFNAAFEPARTPYDWLSRDEAEVDAYVADPLSGDDMPMTYRFVADLMGLTADETTPEAIGRLRPDLPVLLLTGARDPVSNAAEGVRLLEARLREAGHPLTARYYADARHEVLNETNRDEVTADLVGWLDRLASS
jgi:alpha-beta hydrolase superfamily lysophospholipase